MLITVSMPNTSSSHPPWAEFNKRVTVGQRTMDYCSCIVLTQAIDWLCLALIIIHSLLPALMHRRRRYSGNGGEVGASKRQPRARHRRCALGAWVIQGHYYSTPNAPVVPATVLLQSLLHATTVTQWAKHPKCRCIPRWYGSKKIIYHCDLDTKTMD